MLKRLETYNPIVMGRSGKKFTLKQRKIENVHSVFLLLVNYAENTLKNSTLNFNTSFCWSHTAKRNPKNGIWLLSSKTSRTFPTDFTLKSNRKYLTTFAHYIYSRSIGTFVHGQIDRWNVPGYARGYTRNIFLDITVFDQEYSLTHIPLYMLEYTRAYGYTHK